MRTMIARPGTVVTTTAADPQHDTANPLPVRLPGHPHTTPATQLHELVAHLRRDGDARAARAGRRAPRTLAEMRTRLPKTTAAKCPRCEGRGCPFCSHRGKV